MIAPIAPGVSILSLHGIPLLGSIPLPTGRHSSSKVNLRVRIQRHLGRIMWEGHIHPIRVDHMRPALPCQVHANGHRLGVRDGVARSGPTRERRSRPDPPHWGCPDVVRGVGSSPLDGVWHIFLSRDHIVDQCCIRRRTHLIAARVARWCWRRASTPLVE